MPDITLSTPNAATATRVANAFAAVFNRPATVLVNDVQVPNPETKDAFVKRQVALWMKGVVLGYEKEQAAIAAQSAADALDIT